MVNLEKLVVSKEVEEIVEVDELTSKRYGYERYYLRDLVDEDVYITGAELTDVTSEMKISQKGNEYESNKAILRLYDDDGEMSISVFLEFFRAYNKEKGELTVRGNSELLSFIRVLLGDYTSNKFVLNYKELQDAVSEITTMSFKVNEEINNAGYTNYSMEVYRIDY